MQNFILDHFYVIATTYFSSVFCFNSIELNAKKDIAFFHEHRVYSQFTFPILPSVSTKALAGAKSLGGFLYSAVNKAGKTVVEASAKIKKTVEENVSFFHCHYNPVNVPIDSALMICVTAVISNDFNWIVRYSRFYSNQMYTFLF